MTHDEMIEVLTHHKNGGKIEYRLKADVTWKDAPSPWWDFDEFDYRAKPEPKVIYADFNANGHPCACSHEKYTPPFGGKLRVIVEVTE
jgi:hypothetical protein